ncbi:hypothetical protein EZY14_002730 [Kordia sp. TARA_039_SRF]|nr:hypothetical protein EZY14_002730 [Kordia sp. TARA_039_SRF]
MSKGISYYCKIMVLTKQFHLLEEEKKKGRFTEDEFQEKIYALLTELKSEVSKSTDTQFTDLLNALIHQVQLSM